MTATVVADARMLAYPIMGIGRYAFELLKRLVGTRGVHWVLLSARPIPPETKDKFSGSVEWIEGDGASRAELWTQRAAARELRHRPFATFLGLSNSLPLLGPGRTTYTLVIYDLCFLTVPALTHPRDLIKGYALTLPSLWKADRILAISPEVESELYRYVRRTRGRTWTLPPGGTQLTPRTQVPYEERRGFVTVGAHRRKNTGLLLEAYGSLPSAVRGRHPLCLLARGMPSALAHRVTDLGLEGQVRLIADASDAELGKLYTECLAVVYPSAYEGLGLPVAEAMLAGTPSIVPARSPMARFLAGAGLVIHPLKVDTLTGAMGTLASDRIAWEECARATEDASRIISWDRVAEAAGAALGLS